MTTLAEQAANEAIAAVSRSLTDDEKLEALVLIGDVGLRLEFFTTDDIPFNFAGDVDRRAAGYAMRAAVTEGFIVPTEQWRKSTQESCHARPKRVWKSCLL